MLKFSPIVYPVTGEMAADGLINCTNNYLTHTLHSKVYMDNSPLWWIHISANSGLWHVFLSYDEESIEHLSEDSRVWLILQSEDKFLEMTPGLDLGDHCHLAESFGQQSGFTVQQDNLLNK